MIDEATYAAFTGSEAPAAFSVLEEIVIDRLETALGRRLVSVSRTEWLRAYRDGVVYPAATPITAAGSLRFTDTCIWVSGAGDHLVTYTGGYTPSGVEGDRPLPPALAAAIAWGIHTLANPNNAALPSGIQSLNVAGEYSITRETGSMWGADGEPLPRWASIIADLGGRCANLAAPYRRVA